MEHIRTPKVENVKLMDKYNPKASPTGNLYLTTSHLIFIEDNLNKETWILHMLMSAIEKPLLTTSGSQLKISCSNFQTVTFTIQRDRDAHDVYQSLLELSKPREVKDLFIVAPYFIFITRRYSRQFHLYKGGIRLNFIFIKEEFQSF